MANSNAVGARKPEEFTIEDVCELLKVKILPSEENDNFFKDIIGNTDIVKSMTEIVNILKTGKSTEILGKDFHPSFLLLGVEGIGKCLTAYAFAKEMELPIIVFDIEKLLQDFSTKMVRGIKRLIEAHRPCVVLFKEVSFISELDSEKAISFYSKICSIKNSFPDSFFFASASTTTEFPSFFVKDEGFETIFSYNPPDPKERQHLIRKFLRAIPHDEKLDVEKLSRDFFGFSGGQIHDFLRKALVQAVLKGKDKLTYELINNTMYSEMYGGKVRKMSEKELRLTAYHEAGHVVAGYFGCPDYKVSKVEVVNRRETLGLTDPEVDEEKHSYTREDIKGRIITALGGKVAEQVIFNTSTSGVVGDLAQAAGVADGYVRRFGMDDSFGPVFVDDDTFYSDELAKIADLKIRELLITLEKETYRVILEHKDKLIGIAEALIKKETLYREEILRILEGSEKKPRKPRTTAN